MSNDHPSPEAVPPPPAALSIEQRARAHMAAVAAGDRRAFRRLHAEFHGPVHNFAMRMLGRADRAEEVVNDTMLAVWRSAGRFEGRSRVSTWIFGIAYRIALKTRRRTGFERLHVALDSLLEIGGGRGADADAIVTANALSIAMRALTEEQRALMYLTYHYGFTVAEISGVTGAPTGTIKARMAAARRKLRNGLTAGEDTQ